MSKVWLVTGSARWAWAAISPKLCSLRVIASSQQPAIPTAWKIW